MIESGRDSRDENYQLRKFVNGIPNLTKIVRMAWWGDEDGYSNRQVYISGKLKLVERPAIDTLTTKHGTYYLNEITNKLYVLLFSEGKKRDRNKIKSSKPYGLDDLKNKWS